MKKLVGQVDTPYQPDPKATYQLDPNVAIRLNYKIRETSNS